jgi:ubiquinone/menaquinone biosynthesis C-methylase UbiE
MIITQRTTTQQKIIDYFEGASLDYYYWDKAFNMHFGYYKAGINPLKRPALLNQLNKEIMERLQLYQYTDPLVLDLGCGLGAASRYMAKENSEAQFYGFTITPWQVEFGNELTKEQKMADQVSLYQSDFTSLPIADESAEAAFAMESACYAAGKDKKDLIQELYRVLKPGGRFVINDGFRKHSRSLPRWLEKVYRKNMDCWALTELADINAFARALKEAGFRNIKVEDASWRVAPSFAHIPFVSIRYYWDIWKKGELKNLDPERKNNVLAPILGMLMGASRRHFGYYIVSGEK